MVLPWLRVGRPSPYVRLSTTLSGVLLSCHGDPQSLFRVSLSRCLCCHLIVRPHPPLHQLCRNLTSIVHGISKSKSACSSTEHAGTSSLLSCGRSWRGHCCHNGRSLATESISPNSLLVHITEFDTTGNYHSKVLKKSEVLFRHGIQPRDIRFSTLSSLFVRGSCIIIRLQYLKAIINYDSVVLLESEQRAVQQCLQEFQQKIAQSIDDPLPYEFKVLEMMLMKVFSVLDDRLNALEPALREVLSSLLDPQLFSVDRGELHILLHHSKSLSEFHSVVKDIEATLTDVLDNEEDMADMYLTHVTTTGEDRDPDEIEEINNILEAYLMQAENMLSEVQKLRDLIDQSESIILINLDSQRNVMMRLSLQLEMGVFSATLAGLIGMAFGMNLDSSLEENPYAFWVTTGCMVMLCGLLWRRLLLFLGTSLSRGPLKRLRSSPRQPKTQK